MPENATVEVISGVPVDKNNTSPSLNFDVSKHVSEMVGGDSFDTTWTITYGSSKKTYNIKVVMAKGAVVVVPPSKVLKDLKVTGGTLTSDFDSAYTSFTVNVDSNATEVTITGEAADPKAKVTGGGKIGIGKLAYDSDTSITIAVTSTSQEVTTYSIKIHKAAGPVDPNAAVKVTMLPNTDVIVESGKTYSVTSSACNSTLAINGSRDIDVLINGTTSVTGMDYKPTGWPGSPFTIKINAGTKISCY